MLRARLFGPLTVEIDGRPVPEIAGLKPRTVLAWLLLHPGSHSRARVAALFWPDVLDTSARASLRNVLWSIRCALEAAGGTAYLDSGRDSVGITGRLPRDVDTETFERLAASTEPAELESAYTLASAPLLADLADEWVLEARGEYRERAAGAALRLADELERAGEPRAAVEWTRRALSQVPLRESVHRALMRRLAATGERAEALAAYGRCRAVLAAEFRTVPSDATQALAARLRSGRQPPRENGTPGRGVEPVRLAPTPVPELPLVGRERELAVLRAAWERARAGRGGVAVVSGAAGLGKSRLLTEMIGCAEADGARHGMGAAYELPGNPPLSVWSEALRELIATVPAPPEEAAWPADLARLCRSVEWRWGRPASAPSADPDQESGWLFDAVAEALAWCSRGRPLLLVLEDVHHADRASIALLAYAGRRLAAVPVLLAVTRRPATARQDLALALDALARRDAIVDQLTLEVLCRDDIERIVAAVTPSLPADARERVVAAAEGNPLLAREAARAAATGRALSHGLREWVRASLARLPDDARLLVDLSAAAGRPLDLGEAAALVGAESLPDALDAAAREELLDTDGSAVRFVHDLVREACYAHLDPPRRVWLHGHLADMLDTRPRRAAVEVARHLVLAGRHDDARGHLVTAGEQARGLGALDEAAGFLREAATIADTSPPAAELWLALAETEAWRNSRDEHDAAFARALALLEQSGERAEIAGAYVTRGRCLRTTLCFPHASLTAYQSALQLIDDGGTYAPELRALALAGCAWVEAANGEVSRGRELVAEAEALPEVLDDPALTAEVGLARAATLLRSRRFNEAERESEQAGELARRAARDDIADLGLLQAAMAAAAQGVVTRALALSQRVLRSRCGTGVRGDALAARAYCLARMGRHQEACAAAREELALLARLGERTQESTAVYHVGSLALAAGRYREAVERLSAALSGDGRFSRALARLRLAEARLRAGEADGADAELSRVPFEAVGPADLPETLVPHLERVQGLVAAARGEADVALQRLSAAEAGWRRLFAAAPADDPYAANLVAIGRSPVEGLVEPGVELGRVLAERALLLAEEGRAAEVRKAADEAAALAASLAYAGYHDALRHAEEIIQG